MKKKITMILAAILICAMAVVLISCGGKGGENQTAEEKPDINTALQNYESLTQKHSDLKVDLKAIIFQNQVKNKQNVLVQIPIVETFEMDRIFDNDKIYIDGKLYTSEIDPSIPTLYATLMNLMSGFGGGSGSSENTGDDGVVNYLKGETSYSFKLGYESGSYNLKLKYENGDEQPREFWGATDNLSIDQLLEYFSADLTFHPNEYLMTSGIVDLTDVSDWLEKDEASKLFSDKQNRFIYNLKISSEKLHDLVFEYIRELAGTLDKEEYADFLAILDEALPYIAKWVTIGDSTVDAKVTRDGKPDEMSTSLTVNLNINMEELSEVLHNAVPDDADQMYSMVNFITTAMGLRGTDGKAGTVGFSFILSMTEKFSYDNVGFENADPDCFIPATEEPAKRRNYLFRIPAPEEEEGSDEEV